MNQTTEKNIIHFGVVGYGHIGKRHAHLIQENAQCRLSGICDVNPLQFNNLNSNLATYSSLESLIKQQPEIDVISIATPNGWHASQAIFALENNKHVLIEKPMALSSKECEQIIDAANKHNKHIFCVMQNRFTPTAQWLKKIIGNQDLGNIYQVIVQCYWNRDHRYYTPNHWHGTKNLDGGILFTQFSHFIDMIYWLLGDIHVTGSQQFQFNHQNLTEFPDAGNFHFNFAKNGKGTFLYSTALFQENFESSITIIAEKGTIKVGGQYMNEISYCNVEGIDKPVFDNTPVPNNYGHYQGSAANHSFVIQEVINTLIHQHPVFTTAMDGKKVVEIIESATAVSNY